MRKSLFLCFIGLFVITFSGVTIAQENTEHACKAPYDSLFQRNLFIISEQKPTYPGGSKQLQKHLLKYVHFTKKGKREGLFSRLTFFLQVEKDGKVSAIKVWDSQKRDLVKAGIIEIRRLLKILARFKPGKCHNKPVAYKITLPIHIHWG
ncbi:MAG TPA: hypothetical protein DCS93_12395 [Microscillaceae bacterium]|nr:hypothetical protein [Microscillaceae bacterium]